MSKTIRNERTKGYLDKLQQQRRTRKLIRDVKMEEELFFDMEDKIIQELE